MSTGSTNTPNNFEDCESFEEAIAFYMNKGYTEDESHEIVRFMSHNSQSNDFYESIPYTKPCFEWWG